MPVSLLSSTNADSVNWMFSLYYLDLSISLFPILVSKAGFVPAPYHCLLVYFDLKLKAKISAFVFA